MTCGDRDWTDVNREIESELDRDIAAALREIREMERKREFKALVCGICVVFAAAIVLAAVLV